eukprot:2615607-Rhodomonas_salina.1
MHVLQAQATRRHRQSQCTESHPHTPPHKDALTQAKSKKHNNPTFTLSPSPHLRRAGTGAAKGDRGRAEAVDRQGRGPRPQIPPHAVCLFASVSLCVSLVTGLPVPVCMAALVYACHVPLLMSHTHPRQTRRCMHTCLPVDSSHAYMPVCHVTLDVPRVSMTVRVRIACRRRMDDKAAIVHRDVSPDNILVTDKNVAKIADFGTAVSTPSLGFGFPVSGLGETGKDLGWFRV